MPYWSRPTVHHGFLRAWLKDNLDKRVVSRCLALAAAWAAAHPGQPVPILVTGALHAPDEQVAPSDHPCLI